MLLISVVTICFNSEKTIKRTIESVLAQNYPSIEYLIIDGGSNDSTLEIVKSYQQKFLNKGFLYKIISEPDNGIYDAMNKGILKSTGEVIGFINSDDWYEPIAIETISKAYEESKFDLFYADLNIIKNNEIKFIKHSKTMKFITTRHWNCPTSFFSRKTFDRIGFFKCKGIADDFDMYLRIRRANMKIIVKNVVLANFSLGGVSNKKNFKEAMSRCKDRYRCYLDNGYSSFYIIECFFMDFIKYLIV